MHYGVRSTARLSSKPLSFLTPPPPLSPDRPFPPLRAIYASTRFCLASSDGRTLLDASIVSEQEMVVDQFHAFCFLSRARQLVTAHSTFSWWVAFLGDATEVHFPLTQHGRGVTGMNVVVTRNPRGTCIAKTAGSSCILDGPYGCLSTTSHFPTLWKKHCTAAAATAVATTAAHGCRVG